MKKIGSGWTFNVYENGEKVLKKKKKFFPRIFKILKGDPRLIFSFNKTIRDLDRLNRESVQVIERLKSTTFDFKTLANPESLREEGYIQSRCIPIGEILKDDKKFEEAIEKYIEQIKYFWGYGFADKIFNFTLNNGLDQYGNVTLFDFNEITTDKNRIISDITQQTWLKRHSFKFDLNENQKEYFKKRMNEEIILENLERFWKVRLTKTAQ